MSLFFKKKFFFMIVLQKRQQFLLKVLQSNVPERLKNYHCLNINFFYVNQIYTRYFSSNINISKDKHDFLLNKKEKIFEINYLKVSDNHDFYSLMTFKNNLLSFWSFGLDNYPLDYLTSELLKIITEITSNNLVDNLDDKFFDIQEDWEYSHYIYMFDKKGKIIGDILEINYNHSNYDYTINGNKIDINYDYDYNLMVNQIYKAIDNNTDFYNRGFYIYIADYDEPRYSRLDMHESLFRIESFL